MWEQLYNYPRYGIGIYSSQFINSSELGKPFAVYGTFVVPLNRWGNFSLYSEIGVGLAFNWKSNEENKYNIALGGKATMYADGALYLEYRSINGVLIDLGLSVSHFSNGALKLPNLGINEFAPKISLGYNFIKSQKESEKLVIPEYNHQTECNISLFTGWENKLYYGIDVDSVTLQKGVYYPAYGFSLSYNRQISYKSKIGMGLMADYMASANTSITVNNGKLEPNNTPFSDGLELSIFPSYELVLNRLSVVMQPGFYIYRIKYPFRLPNFYQRIGLKFNVSKDIFLGINIRAHRFSIADYIEWTFGYRIHL